MVAPVQHPSYTEISPPTAHTNQPIHFQPAKILAENALPACYQLTTESYNILKLKHSFFVMGWQMMHESGGDYGKPIGEGIGAMMIASAFVFDPARIILGAAGLVAGALGTAVTAPIYYVHSFIHNTFGDKELDNPHGQKMALTAAFAERMYQLLNQSSFNGQGKNFFRENPKELIVLASIQLAYYSRDEKWGDLKMMDNQILVYKDIQNLDQASKNYFSCVADLKNLLKYHVKFNDWNNLMQNLDALSIGASTDLTKAEIEDYNKLSELAHFLAEKLFEDSDFKAVWKHHTSISVVSHPVKSGLPDDSQ